MLDGVNPTSSRTQVSSLSVAHASKPRPDWTELFLPGAANCDTPRSATDTTGAARLRKRSSRSPRIATVQRPITSGTSAMRLRPLGGRKSKPTKDRIKRGPVRCQPGGGGAQGAPVWALGKRGRWSCQVSFGTLARLGINPFAGILNGEFNGADDRGGS